MVTSFFRFLENQDFNNPLRAYVMFNVDLRKYEKIKKRVKKLKNVDGYKIIHQTGSDDNYTNFLEIKGPDKEFLEAFIPNKIRSIEGITDMKVFLTRGDEEEYEPKEGRESNGDSLSSNLASIMEKLKGFDK
ncbi:MAG: hypothetical protein ACE5J7_04785 [Candidatus Aenigmatarchaeota archaeon]